MNIKRLLLLCLVLSGAVIAQDSDCRVIRCADLADRSAPALSKYTVRIPPTPVHPKLDLSTNPIARTYRTVLRQDIRNGPNFAGSYRVTVWGCGSSCAMFAVTNLENGKVITTNIVQNVNGVHLAADDFLKSAATNYWGFRFAKNSALLVIVGTLNDDESQQGAFYFMLENDRLVLLHKTLVKKSCPE